MKIEFRFSPILDSTFIDLIAENDAETFQLEFIRNELMKPDHNVTKGIEFSATQVRHNWERATVNSLEFKLHKK